MLLLLTDALAFDWTTDFSDADYAVFPDAGACACGEGLRACNCSGDAVAAGQVGFDLTPCRPATAYGGGSCPDLVWKYGVQVAQGAAGGSYAVLVRNAGYVDRVAVVAADADSIVRVVMVRVPPGGELVAVLTWGGAPLDLDLWVIPDDKVGTWPADSDRRRDSDGRSRVRPRSEGGREARSKDSDKTAAGAATRRRPRAGEGGGMRDEGGAHRQAAAGRGGHLTARGL